MKRKAIWLAAAAAVLLAGCAGGGGLFGPGDPARTSGPRGMHSDPSGAAAGIKQLLSYDADKDGSVTHAEMMAGLRADFAALDKDHSGKLTADEVRAENARRYEADGPQYSPLLDWNQDGVIDFTEFSSTVRSLFDQLDRDHDGVLSPLELKSPQGPTLEEHHQPERN